MKSAIWKFPLVVADRQTVLMPAGAKILTAQVQGTSAICLWAMVDTDETSSESIVIDIIPTGALMSAELRHYIATVQLLGGGLVYHVFEVP